MEGREGGEGEGASINYRRWFEMKDEKVYKYEHSELLQSNHTISQHSRTYLN